MDFSLVGAEIRRSTPRTTARSFISGLRLQLADLQVAEADPVAVVLQQQVAALVLVEAVHTLELAVGDRLAKRVRVQLVSEDLAAVEPVLDVVALQDDARLVELPRRPRLRRRGRQHVVEGSGPAAVARAGVG